MASHFLAHVPLKDCPVRLCYERDTKKWIISSRYALVEASMEDIFRSIQTLSRMSPNPCVQMKSSDDRVNIEDIARFLTIVCDESLVQNNLKDIMKCFSFDLKSISRKDFLLQLANPKILTLNWCELLFVTAEEPRSSKLALLWAVTNMLLIIISSVIFIIATDPQFQERTKNENPPNEVQILRNGETVCIFIFSIDYMIRVLTAWNVREFVHKNVLELDLLPSVSGEVVEYESANDIFTPQLQEAFSSPWNRTVRFVTNPMNAIDLVAILPFYLTRVVNGDGGGLGVLRILRLCRIFRLAKFGKLNEGVTLISRVIRRSIPSLKLLCFFSTIGCVLFGSMIYLCELGNFQSGIGWVRPDKFGDGEEMTPFTTIPRSMWWVFISATTVGYGDLYPTTSMGKVVGTITMLSGILVLALPITIVSSNFSSEFEKVESEKNPDLSNQSRRSFNCHPLQNMLHSDHSLPSHLKVSILNESYSHSTVDNCFRKKAVGQLQRRIEKYYGVLLSAGDFVAFLQGLCDRDFISETMSVTITREVLYLIHQVAENRIDYSDKSTFDSVMFDSSLKLILLWCHRGLSISSSCSTMPGIGEALDIPRKHLSVRDEQTLRMCLYSFVRDIIGD